jgi:damage-control phosphatase, subfamily I
MKSSIQCRPCLERLVYQAAEIATPDPELRERARQEGLIILERLFSCRSITTQIATQIHRSIRKLTGNPDPYRQMKDIEIEISRQLIKEVHPYHGEDLRSCIKLSVLGNTIDFFKEPVRIIKEMEKPVEFSIDHIDDMERGLKEAKKVLYLADNAGECFFDLPLLRKIRETTQAIYVVKGSPVQNDITLADLSLAGLLQDMGEVMTTGTDTVGIDFDCISEEFKDQFDSADLVLAKGMGHYETLTELPLHGKIAYCFKAKCQPVAGSLQVPLNSYIMMYR